MSKYKTLNKNGHKFLALKCFCDLLNLHSPNSHKYEIKDTYMDYGAGISWTTIVDTTKNAQVLSPKQWKEIVNYDINKDNFYNILDDFFNNEFCLDKPSPKHTISKERLFEIAIMFKDQLFSNNIDKWFFIDRNNIDIKELKYFEMNHNGFEYDRLLELTKNLFEDISECFDVDEDIMLETFIDKCELSNEEKAIIMPELLEEELEYTQ